MGILDQRMFDLNGEPHYRIGCFHPDRFAGSANRLRLRGAYRPTAGVAAANENENDSPTNNATDTRRANANDVVMVFAARVGIGVVVVSDGETENDNATGGHNDTCPIFHIKKTPP
jgi:hypothetical protein